MSRTKKRKTSIPVLLVVLGGVLLFGAAIALAVQLKQNVPVQQADNHEEEFANIERVTLENAKKAFDLGQAVFLDVRGPAAFDAGRIPGALLIPMNELETRLSELNPNDWIITYCTWPAEESSARAAQILIDNGFKRTNPILGGFQAWQAAGYPVTSGK